MLQSNGLANTPYLACLFEVPAPKHPNGPPGTDFWEEETKEPKTLAGYRCTVSETGRSRTTPPIRRISHAARNSPVARDCVVGPRGLEPPTRPLYPDASGAYFIVPHNVFQLSPGISSNADDGIALRDVRRLRLLSGVDFVE
jgi:hypothetical protein